MRSMFKAIAATALLAAPLYANAIPMTWDYLGACTGGVCAVIPSITGTLSGDPTLDPFGNDDQLTDLFLIGELTSYDFIIAGQHFTGSDAFGEYRLNSAGNIIDGTMTFGGLGLTLRIGDVSDAVWSFDCSRFVCGSSIEAWGSGSYTRHTTAVPEPTTLSLLGLGLLGFGLARRRRAR